MEYPYICDFTSFSLFESIIKKFSSIILFLLILLVKNSKNIRNNIITIHFALLKNIELYLLYLIFESIFNLNTRFIIS